MALINDICDAVVTSLNAASLSQSFTAARKYRDERTLPDLSDDSEATIYVMPTERSPGPRLSRRPSRTLDYFVDIGLWKTIDVTSDTAPDIWMTLIEEIDDHLMGAGTMSGATWLDSSIPSIYVAELLDDEHVFAVVLRTQYRKRRN